MWVFCDKMALLSFKNAHQSTRRYYGFGPAASRVGRGQRGANLRRDHGDARRLGYRADCETDSLSALKSFSEAPAKFALAIIEPLLPNLTGLDLATRFRHIRADLPVVFYAGYVEESLSRPNRDRPPRARSLQTVQIK